MFTTKDSKTSRQLPDFDRMAYAQLKQNHGVPYVNLSSLTADVAFQARANSCSRTGEFFKLQSPHGLTKPEKALPHGLGISEKPVDPSHQERRFLVFDRSGDHTTYFFSPSFCLPQNPVIAPVAEKVAACADKLSSPSFEEKWEENDLNDGEDEMLEDSDEINALLYSDSDYDDDDDDDDDDEVTSTARISLESDEGRGKEKLFEGIIEGRDGSTAYDQGLSTPITFIEPLIPPVVSPLKLNIDPNNCATQCKGHRQLRSQFFLDSPLVEDAASCDGSCKRLRLLDRGHKKTFESIVNDGISSCNDQNGDVKIHEMLKILRKLVPGLERSNGPSAVIEKAIVYLESMRIEAEALGLACAESELPFCP